MHRKSNTINRRMATKDIVMIALMTALTCVLAPLSIPTGTGVPFSLTNFVIYITSVLLGGWKSLLALIAYLLLGMCGVPVFAGYRAGLAVLAGPTGGYIVGFLFIPLITGFASDIFKRKRLPLAIAMILSGIMVYLFGTIWFSIITEKTFIASLKLCVVPYIWFDLLKIAISVIFIPTLANRIDKIVVKGKRKPNIQGVSKEDNIEVVAESIDFSDVLEEK